MPRGVRKLGQFKYIVWTPKGARIEEYSTRNLTHAEFIADLRRVSERLKQIADTYEKRGDA